MHGFPPAPESRVTLENWRRSPFNRWSFQHVRELVPSADIPNDPAAGWPLPSDFIHMDALAIPADGGRVLAFD